jgi:tetratricopeptide (TPR) repeat protein
MRRDRTALALLIFTLLALPLSAPRPARAADDAEAEARRHYNDGRRLYDEQKYLAAAREFEAGYAILSKPGFLINIGHSYRRAGELRKAKHYYELFLEKDKSSPQRDEVQTHIKTIDETLADEAAAEAVKAPPAPQPAPAAPVHVAARPEPSERTARPLWPWLVSGAAVALAGAVVGVVLATRPAKGEACGTLGCLNER